MTKIFYTFILLITCLTACGQNKTNNQQSESEFYSATKNWFSAWELVSKDIYKIKKLSRVEFVFFDDKYVYSTSNVTIKKGTPIKGPNLMNLNLNWEKALHSDSLTLPDSSVVSVKLMSFASPISNDTNESFFIMPLPSYWEQKGITSKELGLDKLITGVFLHEFSHSQQMQGFGEKITQFEKEYDIALSDDIVQDIFEKDTTYVKLYKKEVNYFYASVQGKSLNKEILRKGLAVMEKRQQRYFIEKYKYLQQIDNFFLTMEGLGQYSMYLWLISPKGGNVKKEVAIKGIRRGKNHWSQDEGLALFLVLDKFTTPKTWAKNMFGEKTESVVTLIEKQITKKK
ncbi:MAG: hypothetical protein JST95_06380 [Bacteroidetes bacterium]|nr:hypothetical protein [Bacteroidota bacterium]